MAAVLATGANAWCADGASSAIDLSSTSFFKQSPDRATNGASIQGRSVFKSQWSAIDAVAQVQANAFLNDRSSITPEATEAYFSTNSGFSTLHRFTLGRRKFDWSVGDDHWGLGNWNSRFVWNPLRPQAVGLTGLTYEYQSRMISIRVMGSNFHIPERGSPLKIVDGKLYYSNPDAAVPLESVSMMNQNVPLYYSLNMPTLRELTVHSSLLAQVRVGEAGRGPWASFSMGTKPMNAADLTAEASLNILPQPVIRAELYPRILSHDLMTIEGGMIHEDLKLWGSVTRETPILAPTPSGRSTAPVGPATIGSMGTDIRLTGRLQLSASLLSILEDLPAPVAGSVQIALPSRYRFKRATQFSLDWQANSRLSTRASWVRDYEQASGWISAQARYQMGSGHRFEAWSLGMGADFFQIGSSQGFLAAYQDNGRLQGMVSYAF